MTNTANIDPYFDDEDVSFSSYTFEKKTNQIDWKIKIFQEENEGIFLCSISIQALLLLMLSVA